MDDCKYFCAFTQSFFAHILYNISIPGSECLFIWFFKLFIGCNIYNANYSASMQCSVRINCNVHYIRRCNIELDTYGSNKL